MGNWFDISEQHFHKSKSPEECEDHYFTFYYKSMENNMPTQDDLIITGPREIESDGQITIPIDETKGKEAQKKLEAFNNFRKSETQQEEEELARKNQSN